MQEIVKKVHHDKALTRLQFWAIVKKAKEGKPAAADRRYLCAQTFITAKVENESRENCSGSWGDNQTISPTLNKDLKLSKKLARWQWQLRDKDMKKERV
jgi:hypothetical protein